MKAPEGDQRERNNAAALGILGLFIVGVALWLACAATLPSTLLGWKSVVITSGSMSPAIEPGDVLLAKPLKGRGIEPGSVILFRSPTGAVTHRVVSIDADGNYLTKGDSNTGVDSTPVSPAQVLGEAQAVIPHAGLPALWWRTGQWAHLVAMGLLLAVAWYAIGVATGIWRGRALDGVLPAVMDSSPRLRGALRPIAAVLAAASLASVMVASSTARGAFLESTGNGPSYFHASTLDRYRLLTWGSGDRDSDLVLPMSALGSATATSVPNYDRDRNADPGLTLQPSLLGLAETDPTRSQIWALMFTAEPTRLAGDTNLRIWMAMRNSGLGRKGEVAVGLYDCDIPRTRCDLFASAVADTPGKQKFSEWAATTVAFGTLDKVVAADHVLVVKLVMGGDAGEGWFAYDTTTEPSALEVS